MSDPVTSWLLISWLLKKLTDHHDRYISEEEYNRLKQEADASLGIVLQEEIKLLPDSKKVG